MKIKVGVAVNLYSALQSLVNAGSTNFSLKVARFRRELGHVNEEYSARRKEILDEYGTPRKGGISYDIPDKNLEKATTLLKELDEEVVTISVAPITVAGIEAENNARVAAGKPELEVSTLIFEALLNVEEWAESDKKPAKAPTAG